MVKKIKKIDDQMAPESDETDNSLSAFEEKMLEYFAAIDWKLWEMTKIMQKLAEREGLSEPSSNDSLEETERPINNYKSIIIDEDDQ